MTAGGWSAELAIPRKILAGEPRINLVHHIPDWRLDGWSSSHSPQSKNLEPARDASIPLLQEPVDFVLCPVYVLSGDPDRIPDWKAEGSSDGSARLVLP